MKNLIVAVDLYVFLYFLFFLCRFCVCSFFSLCVLCSNLCVRDLTQSSSRTNTGKVLLLLNATSSTRLRPRARARASCACACWPAREAALGTDPCQLQLPWRQLPGCPAAPSSCPHRYPAAELARTSKGTLRARNLSGGEKKISICFILFVLGSGRASRRLRARGCWACCSPWQDSTSAENKWKRSAGADLNTHPFLAQWGRQLFSTKSAKILKSLRSRIFHAIPACQLLLF